MRNIKAYWADCGNNFGDNITWYLFWKICGIHLTLVKPNEAQFVGSGSIIEHLNDDYNGIVFGSGIMFSETRKELPSANIIGVRGHLTKERMGIDSDIILGDLGMLSHLLCKSRDKKYKLGIIPHYADFNNPQVKEWSGVSGVKIINIRSSVQNVIDEVSKCETIVSSALHGLILADSLNIPNEWIELSDKVAGNGFKFRDYYSIYDLIVEPKHKIDWVGGEYERPNIEDIKDKIHKRFLELCATI